MSTTSNSASIGIKNDVTFEEIELSLQKIDDCAKEFLHLRLPSTLKFSGGFGREIALIQLIITWARCSCVGEFHTYLDKTYFKEYFEELNSQLYGICALAMSPKITDTKHNPILRRDALQSAALMIEAMDSSHYSKTGKGPEVNLVSISGAKREYIGSLYAIKDPNGLKSRTALTSEIENILSKISAASGDKMSFQAIENEDFYGKIAQILFELFKNIDEHSKSDEIGNKYSRTIGGVKFGGSIYRTKQEKESLLNYFSHDQNATQYIQYLIDQKGPKESNKIFEISIFDSGPGYARRWTKKAFSELTFKEEQSAFLACLEKHGTTKQDESAGEGLSNVRETLQVMNGYMRIRSGRMCYQDFYINGKTHPSFNQEFLAPVEGTTISICIPF